MIDSLMEQRKKSLNAPSAQIDKQPSKGDLSVILQTVAQEKALKTSCESPNGKNNVATCRLGDSAPATSDSAPINPEL